MYKDVYKICLHHVVVCNTTLKYIFISGWGLGGGGGGVGVGGGLGGGIEWSTIVLYLYSHKCSNNQIAGVLVVIGTAWIDHSKK